MITVVGNVNLNFGEVKFASSNAESLLLVVHDSGPNFYYLVYAKNGIHKIDKKFNAMLIPERGSVICKVDDLKPIKLTYYMEENIIKAINAWSDK